MAFDDPFKLRALKALTDALKEITPDNGYVSDLADFVAGDGVTTARVYRGRAWFGEGDPVPLVSILEGLSPADLVEEPPLVTTTGEFDWPLMIQWFVQDDPSNPTDPSYVLEADIKRRLAIEGRRKVPGGNMPDPLGLGLGKNQIIAMRIGAGVCRPADDVSAKAWGWLSLILRVTVNPAEPYA